MDNDPGNIQEILIVRHEPIDAMRLHKRHDAKRIFVSTKHFSPAGISGLILGLLIKVIRRFDDVPQQVRIERDAVPAEPFQ